MRLDICLQAVGEHAWGVSGGWINAAKRLGVLNRVFHPTMDADDGLFEYLPNCEADMILMLGFDWHSIPLHNPDAWKACKAKKIVYTQESITGFSEMTRQPVMLNAAKAANECCDMWVYTSIEDGEIMRGFGKPCLWQPFGVDLDVFKVTMPFSSRSDTPFFRGKVEFSFDKNPPHGDLVPVYQKRAELVRLLETKGLLDVERFDYKPMNPQFYADQLNDRKIVVNLPSVFLGHPTRCTEAMACGCCLITNLTLVEELDQLFGLDNSKLQYYHADNPETLEGAVRYLMAHPKEAEEIANRGCRYVQERFGLHMLLDQILKKAGEL